MPEFLDIRTLFFIGAMNAFICAVMMISSRRLHESSRAALMWAGATEIVLGLAMLLIAMRGVVPNWVSVWLANTLGSLGALALYQCVRLLTMHRPLRASLWILAGAVVAAQSALGAGPDTHAARLLMTSLLQGGACILSLPLLYSRIGKDAPAPMRWGLLLIAVFAVMHTLRVWSVVAHGVRVESGGMVEGTVIVLLMVTLFALVPMSFSLVVMGMVNGRIAGDLRKLAITDSLTGVLTRRGFYDKTPRFYAKCEDLGRTVACLMLDLDHFKSINDRFGHASGDRVLKHFARLLRDTLPSGSLAGRYGGEEFCVLLGCVDPADASRIAQNVRRALRANPIEDGAQQIPVTVSIGVATRPDDGDSLKALLLAADRRVYLAKNGGRDQVVDQDVAVTAHAHGTPPRELLPI